MIILSNHVNVAIRKRKTGGKTLTARQLRDQGGIDTLVQFDNGYRILKQVRGSPAYWESARKELMAMIRQLGPATIFITFSAAETHWYHLLQILSKLVDDKQLTDDECKELSWSDKCRLINSDPVTCSRHFQYSFNTFLNTFIKSPLCPFGRLKDHWYRVEFQHRGSPHIHMLLWIEDAPQYGKDDESNVIEYIDKIISCRHTWNLEEVDNLTGLQVHRHTKTCKKTVKKTVSCRFGFPKYPMRETCILQPLASDPSSPTDREMYVQQLNTIKTVLGQMKPDSDIHTMDEFLGAVGLDHDDYISAIRFSLKTDTVFLKRSPADIRVNNYNIDVLKAWRANMDIQYILDVWACAAYITGYVAKSSRGMSDLLQKACREAKEGDKNIKQQLRFIGNKFLNNVEISAQEAVYILLELPLKCSSRRVLFINTSAPNERVYLMKNNISDLPDDVEVAAGNLISRYSSRHKSLETITLADYAAWYDQPRSTETVHDDDNTAEDCDDTVLTEHKVHKRKHPRVIRFVKYKEDDMENYCREKLMLYTSWRNEESDLYGGFQTYEDHYNYRKQDIEHQMDIYEPFTQAVDFAEKMLAAEEPEEDWDILAPNAQQCEKESRDMGDIISDQHAIVNPDAHGISDSYDIGIDMGLASSSGTTDNHQNNRYNMPDDQYYSLMRSLNHEQMVILYDIVYHLKTSETQLFRFISGGAGTGKSYVLRALRETLERFFRSRSGTDFTHNYCTTIAPTGKAAYLAAGNTIHSVIRVPANQSLKYTRLDHDSLNTLRTEIGHIKVWLIDEISMCGNRLFSFIDQRLQEVSNINKPFGGTSVIVFGDLYQLPPVMDCFIFQDISCNKNNDDYSVLAHNLWQTYFTMFELKTVMRQ